MADMNEEFGGGALPRPDVQLPIRGAEFQRPDADLVTAMYGVSSATASAILHKLGVRQTFIQGPIARLPGTKVVGSALTLQFMPQREDIASGLQQEHGEKVQCVVGGAGDGTTGRCAGGAGLWRPLHGMLWRDADHLLQGARRRGHRGRWVYQRLAEGAGDRPAGVDAGSYTELRITIDVVSVGLQRAHRVQSGVGAAGRYYYRRRRRRRRRADPISAHGLAAHT